MSTATSTASFETVARVVFPEAGEESLALYVEMLGEQFPSIKDLPEGWSGELESGEYRVSRNALAVPRRSRTSFLSFFNGFPASYWRRWTAVKTVRLSLSVSAEARVVAYTSNAVGIAKQFATKTGSGEITFDVPISSFGDGGWVWFEVQAAAKTVVISDAVWQVPEADRQRNGSASVAITTFNKPDYCITNIRAFKEADLPEIDKIIIVDQGTEKVCEEEGYDELKAALGDRLEIVEQGNLGGAGGFARAAHEVSTGGTSEYMLYSDDDVVIEMEGVRRSVLLSNYATSPMLIGGHMFSLSQPTLLHTTGERVNEHKFFYEQIADAAHDHDLGETPLRSEPKLHQRVDADYNAWWMILVPVAAIKELGYSLPLFIKWDDVEYGYRAKQAGIPTVTYPGFAVWHMPFGDKDDTVAWQAYFHQRNRWIAGLLYSPYAKGGALIKESFKHDVKHLMAMQYSVVHLRHKALRDLMKGPRELHPTLGKKLGEAATLRKEFTDAQVKSEISDFPALRSRATPRRSTSVKMPNTYTKFLRRVAHGTVNQMKSVAEGIESHPELIIPSRNAKWWRLALEDSVLVTNAEGTGLSWYRRAPQEFKDLLKESIALHRELAACWDELSWQFRGAAADLTAPATWEKTFAENPPSPSKK